MTVSQILRERRLSAVKKSIAASESHQKTVQAVAAKTAALLTTSVVGGHKDHLEEYALRDAYTRQLETYTGVKNHGYTGAPFTARGLALWGRVAKAWRQTSLSIPDFIATQFTWFHNAFRKAPEPYQLATEEAVLRAHSVTPEKVRTVAREAEIDTSTLFSMCEKQIQTVMRQHKLTREEVYLRFVKTGLLPISQQFLKCDPAWRRVCND